MTDRPALTQKRHDDRNFYREALLSATARVIMKHGISGATISNIQQESGLSRGMINLHFQSKENLILALAKQRGEKYDAAWLDFLSPDKCEIASPEAAALRLSNLFEIDLSEAALNTEAARLTFVFRAELKMHSSCPPYIDTRQSLLQTAIQACCVALCAGSNAFIDPRHVELALLSMLEGFWTDFHMHPDAFDRNNALDVCHSVCRAYFPEYFKGTRAT